MTLHNKDIAEVGWFIKDGSALLQTKEKYVVQQVSSKLTLIQSKNWALAGDKFLSPLNRVLLNPANRRVEELEGLGFSGFRFA